MAETGQRSEISKYNTKSTATVSNIFRLQETKSPPKRDDNIIRKLDEYHELYIIGLISECPNLQLQEIAYKVKRLLALIVGPGLLDIGIVIDRRLKFTIMFPVLQER